MNSSEGLNLIDLFHHLLARLLIIILNPLVVPDAAARLPPGGDLHLALHLILVKSSDNLCVQFFSASIFLSHLLVGHHVPSNGDRAGCSSSISSYLNEFFVNGVLCLALFSSV